MSNGRDTWKLVALTGVLSVAVASTASVDPALKSTDDLVRLKAVRDWAKGEGFVVRDRDKPIVVADDPRYTKVDPDKEKKK